MNDRPSEQDELVLDAYIVPSIDAAAQTWYDARQGFQNEAGKVQRDAYMKGCDELAQALSVWADQLPGFREQLSMWVDSHPEY